MSKCKLQKHTFTSKSEEKKICSSLHRLVLCVHGRLPRLSPLTVQDGLDAARELRRDRKVRLAVCAYSSHVAIAELASC